MKVTSLCNLHALPYNRLKQYGIAKKIKRGYFSHVRTIRGGCDERGVRFPKSPTV